MLALFALLLLVGCGGGGAAQPAETAAIAPVGPTTAAPTIPPTLSPTPELPAPTRAPVFRRLVELYYGLRPLTPYPAWP